MSPPVFGTGVAWRRRPVWRFRSAEFVDLSGTFDHGGFCFLLLVAMPGAPFVACLSICLPSIRLCLQEATSNKVPESLQGAAGDSLHLVRPDRLEDARIPGEDALVSRCFFPLRSDATGDSRLRDQRNSGEHTLTIIGREAGSVKPSSRIRSPLRAKTVSP